VELTLSKWSNRQIDIGKVGRFGTIKLSIGERATFQLSHRQIDPLMLQRCGQMTIPFCGIDIFQMVKSTN